MLTQSKVLQSFQRALNSYDDEATVQKDCANNLAAYLETLDIPNRLDRGFEFGCGTGFLTRRILDQFSISQFIVNDLLDDCELFLESSGVDHATFEFISGDVEQIDMPQECDIICSSSCIQWSTNQQKLLDDLGSALKKNGILAICSFSRGHFKELEALRHDNSNRNDLNYWSAEVWQQQLHSNFELEIIKTSKVVLWFDSVRDVLLHLRLTGVNGNVGQNWSQQSLSEFENQYRKQFEKDGQISLTYKPIYVVARKKA